MQTAGATNVPAFVRIAYSSIPRVCEIAAFTLCLARADESRCLSDIFEPEELDTDWETVELRNLGAYTTGAARVSTACSPLAGVLGTAHAASEVQ